MGLERLMAVAATWAFALLIALAHAPSALAQTAEPVETAEMQEARALFEQGRAALESGRFVEAERAFARSLELSGNRGTAFNLGVTYRGMGRFLDCRAMLQRLIAGEFGPVGESQRAEVVAIIEDVSRAMGTLHVSISPPTAEVRVDGRSVEVGAPIEVDPGRHVVVASAEGRFPSQDVIEIQTGEQRSLRVELPVLSTGGTDDAVIGWSIGGGVLAGAGLALLIGLLVTPTDPLPPRSSPVFGIVMALEVP